MNDTATDPLPRPYLSLSTQIQFNDLSLGQAPAHVVQTAPPPAADPLHCAATTELTQVRLSQKSTKKQKPTEDLGRMTPQLYGGGE